MMLEEVFCFCRKRFLPNQILIHYQFTIFRGGSMNRLIGVFALALACLAPVFFGCSSAPRMMTYYSLEPTEPQTKNDVTIEVRYIKEADVQKYRELGINRDLLKETGSSWRAISSEKDGILWVYPFQGIVGFWVRIKNNTDHILRMRDSRVYLVIGSETYEAISDPSNWAQLMLEKNGSHTIESEFITAKAKEIKLISAPPVEILPGFEQKGFAVFAVDPKLASEGKLAFFDIITKVDKAGNTVEKTNFEFKIARHEVAATK